MQWPNIGLLCYSPLTFSLLQESPSPRAEQRGMRQLIGIVAPKVKVLPRGEDIAVYGLHPPSPGPEDIYRHSLPLYGRLPGSKA
jgi:hypothetical protein